LAWDDGSCEKVLGRLVLYDKTRKLYGIAPGEDYQELEWFTNCEPRIVEDSEQTPPRHCKTCLRFSEEHSVCTRDDTLIDTPEEFYCYEHSDFDEEDYYSAPDVSLNL
jgi:hypothetical protein